MNKHLHRLVFDRSRGFCVAVAETVASAGKSAAGEGPCRRWRACVAAGLAATALAAQGQGLPGGSSSAGSVPPRPALLPTGATVVKGAATIGMND